VLAVSALALPAVLGMTGMAAASTPHHPPKHHHHKVEKKVDQDQDNKTEQSNKNEQPIVQINTGDKGHQNATAYNDQDNSNKTAQEQNAGGEDDD
jgi:hypothetical protein